jgi:general nucleoside transport system permease protein
VIENLVNSLNLKWGLERRKDVSPWRRVLFKLLAIVLALVIAWVAVKLGGMSFPAMLKKVVISTFGTDYGRQQLAILITPLILTGVAVIIGQKLNLFNVGVEGQLYMGAWGGALVGLHVDGPTILMLPAMFVAGALVGAIWAYFPTILRIKAGISEILTTLLLNFVAYQWIYYWTFGPWLDKDVANLSASEKIVYELPTIIGSVNIGIIIALLAPVVLYLALESTVWGYEVSTIGGNRRAGDFAGMPAVRHMLTVMLISGAVAGIAGVVEVTGTVHRLSISISQGYGFLGVMVGILAEGSAIALVPSAFLLAIILNAGIVLKTQGLSFNAVLALTGLILFLAAIGEVAAKYRFVRVTEDALAAEARESENLPTAVPLEAIKPKTAGEE